MPSHGGSSAGCFFDPSHEFAGVAEAAIGLSSALISIFAGLCFVVGIEVDIIGVEFRQRPGMRAESAVETEVGILDAGAEGCAKRAISQEVEVDEESLVHGSFELFWAVDRKLDLAAERRGSHRGTPNGARQDNLVLRAGKNYIPGPA